MNSTRHHGAVEIENASVPVTIVSMDLVLNGLLNHVQLGKICRLGY